MNYSKVWFCYTEKVLGEGGGGATRKDNDTLQVCTLTYSLSHTHTHTHTCEIECQKEYFLNISLSKSYLNSIQNCINLDADR